MRFRETLIPDEGRVTDHGVKRWPRRALPPSKEITYLYCFAAGQTDLGGKSSVCFLCLTRYDFNSREVIGNCGPARSQVCKPGSRGSQEDAVAAARFQDDISSATDCPFGEPSRYFGRRVVT